MSIMKYGVFGPQNGRVGNLVFYTLNGQNVCRRIGRPRKTTSEDQKGNEKSMSVTMRLLKSLQDFIKIGFEHKAQGTIWNAFNLAVSYNKKYALKGQNPYIEVDYEKVLLSNGPLPTTEQASIEKVEGGVLLNWDTTEDYNKGSYGHDMVLVALYNPESGGSKIYLNEAKRKDGKVFIPVEQKSCLDQPMEAYMCFKSVDGKRISDSVYLGNLNGPAETEQAKEERLHYAEVKARLEAFEISFQKEQKMYEKSGKKTKNYKYVMLKYKEVKEKFRLLSGNMKI